MKPLYQMHDYIENWVRKLYKIVWL